MYSCSRYRYRVNLQLLAPVIVTYSGGECPLPSLRVWGYTRRTCTCIRLMCMLHYTSHISSWFEPACTVLPRAPTNYNNRSETGTPPAPEAGSELDQLSIIHLIQSINPTSAPSATKYIVLYSPVHYELPTSQVAMRQTPPTPPMHVPSGVATTPLSSYMHERYPAEQIRREINQHHRIHHPWIIKL